MNTFRKAFIGILLALIVPFSIFFCQERLCEDAIVLIPMRDGMQLPTAIYFPHENGEIVSEKFPCVLVRHPLGIKKFDKAWNELLDAGYIVAIQAIRSTCDLSGKTIPYVTDGWGELSDGYDTVEWLGRCGWTNGKIGTIGTSAAGITQYLLAPSRPPHLVCQHIELAPSSLYQYAVWTSGQFRKESVEGWLKVHNRAPEILSYLQNQKYYNSFWKSFDSISHAMNIEVPQAHVTGWYDLFLQGTIDAFLASQEYNESYIAEQHKLIIGPWSHRFKLESTFGDFDLPPKSKTPLYPVSVTAWLDFHLKNIPNSISYTPQIQYYVMGPLDGTPSSGNIWKVAKKWPPDATHAQLYLSNDGRLISDRLQCKKESYDLLINLKDPVPTMGGRNLFIPAGPRDQRSIEERKDVIVFTTHELSEDYEITGNVTACLFIDPIKEESSICLRLSDVYPDGRSILIAEGVQHISPIASNNPTPILVDLWSTSMVFAKGHKIRLCVSGSNYPAYDIVHEMKNPSKLQISTGGKYASYITLPQITNKSDNSDLPKIQEFIDKAYTTFDPWPHTFSRHNCSVCL